MKDSRPRKRRGSVERRPPAPPEPAPPPPPPAPPTEAEISGMATMLSFAWGAMCERVRHRPLEEAEAKELASAVIPVANKYGGGFLEKWSAEITLVLVCWGLWENTALPEAPAPAAPPPGETTQ